MQVVVIYEKVWVNKKKVLRNVRHKLGVPFKKAKCTTCGSRATVCP